MHDRFEVLDTRVNSNAFHLHQALTTGQVTTELRGGEVMRLLLCPQYTYTCVQKEPTFCCNGYILYVYYTLYHILNVRDLLKERTSSGKVLKFSNSFTVFLKVGKRLRSLIILMCSIFCNNIYADLVTCYSKEYRVLP